VRAWLRVWRTSENINAIRVIVKGEYIVESKTPSANPFPPITALLKEGK
jgi:hypothetical protein